MFGITILDHSDNGVLSLDLKDILWLLGLQAESSEWEISQVEALDGVGAEELHSLADKGTRVSGQELIRLASAVTQIIDGIFRGYQKDTSEPWIIIQAVDSSAFDVQSDDNDVIHRIRQQFRDVVDFPLINTRWQDPFGAWSDLPDTMFDDLDQLRHTNPPTPPLELP
jgi:hypothetical protein